MNQVTKQVGYRSRTLASVRGDLTKEQVDAIVNAANSRLVHGGGVAGAISRSGGPAIQEESLRVAPVATGGAGVTGAGSLPCKFVIHAVGPVWGGGGSGEDKLLARAVDSSLVIAGQKMCRSISFPAISAGIFGYPPDAAVKIIVDAVCEFFARQPDSPVAEVRFCCLDAEMNARFDRELARLAG
jgi:O-acetyl-ADP-ribose deacetylase (regulator of RNase III)